MATPPPPPDAAAMPADASAAAALIAERLGMALPEECIAGVLHNTALLDAHWTNLRGFPLPDA